MNRYYDQRDFKDTNAHEIVKLSAENNEVFAAIKKVGKTYYVTIKDEPNGNEVLKFSTESYPRAILEFRIISKVFLNTLEEIAWELQEF